MTTVGLEEGEEEDTLRKVGSLEQIVIASFDPAAAATTTDAASMQVIDSRRGERGGGAPNVAE